MRSTQRPDGSLEEIPPERCPAGHPLLPHGTLVGWSPCDCTPGVHGYRTYTCRYSVNGAECGLVLNFPPCRDPSAGPVVVGLINLELEFPMELAFPSLPQTYLGQRGLRLALSAFPT